MKVSLNHRCDRRVRYCALIFAADIVPSLSAIEWDLKKAGLRVNRELSHAAKELNIVSNTKVQFLKKAIDRFC